MGANYPGYRDLSNRGGVGRGRDDKLADQRIDQTASPVTVAPQDP